MKLPARMAVVAAAVALVFFSSPLGAYQQEKGDYAFWPEMPEAARVIKDVQGKNEVDTAARRLAAYRLLDGLVRANAGRVGRLPWPPREQALYHAYAGLIYERQRTNEYGPRDQQIQAQSFRLQAERAFTRPLLARYFSPAALREIEPIVSSVEADAQRRVNQEPRSPATAGSAWSTPAPPGGIPSGNLLVYTVVALLLLALALARETRPFVLDDSDPFTIRSGWTSYKAHSSTGTVLSPTKSRVVTTHVSGGGSYVRDGVVHSEPVSTSTSTSIHDQFFIREDKGFERPIQLTNVNIAVRDGHRLSAVWGIRKGKQSGSYFLFRNHSTRDVDFIDGVLGGMMHPHRWPVLPLLLITLVVAFNFLPIRTCLSCLVHNKPVPAATYDSDIAVAGVSIGLLLATVVGTPMVFFIVGSVAAKLRVRRLKRQLTEKLLPILDRRRDSPSTEAEIAAH